MLAHLHHRLKCDRQRPCSSCTSRNLASSCTFVTNPLESNARAGRKTAARPVHSIIDDRIDRLESLVVSVMQSSSSDKSQYPNLPTPGQSSVSEQSAQGTPSSDIDLALSPSRIEAMNLNGSGNRYISGAHWEAILDGIAELKSHVHQQDDDGSDSSVSGIQATRPPGAHLLYGLSTNHTREDILAGIPPRSTTDRLLSAYFNTIDMAPGRLACHVINIFAT